MGSGAQPGQPSLFIENKNQWDRGFLYAADFPGAHVFLKRSSLFVMQYVQHNPEKTSNLLPTDINESHHHGNSGIDLSTFEVEFLGAGRVSLHATAQGITRYNYFLGNDRRTWAQGARSFAQVNYTEVYDGIGLRVYSSDDRLKYDWLVSPCADPGNIKVRYRGVDRIYLENGNLNITTRVGQVNESAPVAWQDINGVRKPVACHFRLDDEVVTFEFPNGYDSNYELVIDPTLIFFSYSGSTWDNWGNTATPDSKGNLYSGGIVSGILNSTGYPVTPGAFQRNYGGGQWDVGIIKYDSIGANVLYTTFLGGNGTETPQSLVVDKNDNLLILGTTSSTDFPGASNSFSGGTSIDPINGVPYAGTDIFIAKLHATGSALMAATYLGGSENDGVNFVAGSMGTPNKTESELGKNYGDQLRGDITVDADNNVYIASNTLSDDFPLVNAGAGVSFKGGTHDAVVAKYSPDLGTLLWTRLIGGSKTDIALSIKVAPSGRLYVAGGTSSLDMAGMNGFRQASNGGIDGWIYELSTDGAEILNGTYLGTNRYDQIYFIDLGTDGSVYAYGQTQGNWPISPVGEVFSQPGAGQFLTKLNHNLHTVMLSTVFGINNSTTSNITPNISPTAFLVNECNNIYMAGWGGAINSPTQSFNGQQITRNYVGGNTNNMTTTPDAFQRTPFGNDFYFIVLSPNAREMVYATFLGGPQAPIHVDGGTSRFDKRGVVYHAVCAGCRNINDFPGRNVPVERRTNRSTGCNNAAFKFDLSALRARIQTNNAQMTQPGLARVCMPDPIVFQNRSINGKRFQWDLGDGTFRDVPDTIRFFHYYANPGRYTVKLKSIDESTCIGVDSTSVIVDVFKPDMSAGPDARICEGSSTRLSGTGAAVWSWRTADNSFTSQEPTPLVSPSVNTSYFVTMTDVNGCVKNDTLKVDVTPLVDVKFEYELTNDCNTRPFLFVRNTTEHGDGQESYFSFGDGHETTETEYTHEYQQDGIYRVSLIGTSGSCVAVSSVEVPFVTVTIPNIITPRLEDGTNDFLRFLGRLPDSIKENLVVKLKVYNRWGRLVFEDQNYKDDWNGDNLDGGVYFYEMEIAGQTSCKGWIELVK